MAPPARFAPHRIALALLVVIVAALYARTAWHEFAYDDRFYVMAPTAEGLPNEMVAEWQDLTGYFTSFYGRGVMPEGRGLRPVTVMSFALVHRLFDGPSATVRAGPQHAVNVVLHIFAMLLAYLLVRRLFASPWPAVVGAAFFGLHALRSDPVISVVGRAEILAFGFGALGLIFYLQALDRHGLARAGRAALAGLALFLAFGSKESALTWAVFVPLWAAVQRRAGLQDQLLPFLGAVCVPAAAFVVLWLPILTGGSFEVDSVFNPLVLASGPERFYTAVMVLGHAALQVLMPLDLRIDYSFNTFELVTHWYDYRFLLPFAVFLAVLVGAIWRRRSHPALFLAVAMFFGFTFATSNIPLVVETIYGERLMYTPGSALALLVAWIADRITGLDSRLPARIGAAAATLWIVTSCLVILDRCTVWRDNTTLFTYEAAAHPESMRLQLYPTAAIIDRGKQIGFAGAEGTELLEQWRRHLDRALAVHPAIRHPQALTQAAYHHLIVAGRLEATGSAEAAARQLALAESCLREALASPMYQRLVGHRAHLQLATLCRIRREFRAERQHLERARDCMPRLAQGYIELANWERRHGTPSGALAALRQSLQVMPDRVDLRVHALAAAWAANDHTAFDRLLGEGERLHGRAHPFVQVHRALVHAREGRHEQAVRLFQVCLPRLTIDPPVPMYTLLPRSLAKLGQVRAALDFLRQQVDRPGLPEDVRNAMRALATELQRK